MSKASDAEQQEAVRQLLKFVKPGDTIYTTLEHVSRSGMQREIKLYKLDGGEAQWLVGYASKALRERRGKRDGLVVSGCGMDMGYHLVYSLARVLYPSGFGCIGEGVAFSNTRCPSNDHSNGDRDYTPHGLFNEESRGEDREPFPGEVADGCKRHWHNDGGYALRHRWL